MDEEKQSFRGNLHAYEYLLGQIYVMLLAEDKNPQGFLEQNAKDVLEKIAKQDELTEIEKESAYGTVRRVMETASVHFETVGAGQMVDLRTNKDMN